MTTFGHGSYVWLPDPEDMFVPAKVLEAFAAGESARLDREGYTVKLSGRDTKDLQRMDEQSLESIENMVTLKDLNEMSILHNLRLRFSRDEIYTQVGSILVAVNPFKLLPLYTAEVLEEYKAGDAREMPPHVYAVASQAFRNMIANGKDQSCIVSGESGAGKTECTKIFLQMLAELSGASSKDTNAAVGEASLQAQLLQSNPLMEAFGNAKTVRNNNSSRFGKWIAVTLNNRKGSVVGGSITEYLLEKSRVVAQAEGERNYHVFYQICAGASMDAEFREKFRLSDPEEYHYLNQSGVIEADGISDEADFETVLNSFETIGIDLREQDDVFRTLAAILHLGNIEFVPGGSSFEEGSKVDNTDMLELCAAQFGVEPSDLEKALCSTNIRTNREVMSKANNPDKATDSRDVLAKEVYQKLFEWLIKRINKSLAKKTKTLEDVSAESKSLIGVLDIFGFESFEFNSFEQLCINYCNEKLQFHFNEHIFQLEQDEYRAEGIDVSAIDFTDNQPTIDLFETKRSGIFAVLDEEMNVPRGSDSGFLTKLTKENSKHPSFGGPGVKTTYERESFTVMHYAGSVMYNVTAFLEKNRDKLSQDIVELLQSSKIKFVTKLAGSSSSSKSGSRSGKKSGASLGTKFKAQLSELMKVLNSTEPHFIRCVKPNEEKVGSLFTSPLVLDQLRYAGLLEVCRIRKIGYPIRKPFKEFFRRYSPLAHGSRAKDAKGLASQLCEKGLLVKGEYQIGKSKVFMRNAPYNDLEAAREIALRQQAVLLQSIARRFIARCQFVKYMATLDQLRAGIKKRDYDMLSDGLDAAGDLPNQGSTLTVVQEAWDLKETLEEERRVVRLLVDAMEKRDINALRTAVSASEQINFAPPEMKEAKALIKVIEEEKRVLESLKDAIEDRNLETITKALKTASKLGLLDHKVAKQATALKERLEEENRIVDAVRNAIDSGDMAALKEAMAEANDMGIDNADIHEGQAALDDELSAASAEEQEQVRRDKEKQQRDREDRIDAIKTELMEAAHDKDLDRIADLKTRILELGVASKEIDSLLSEATELEDMDEIAQELEANMNTLATIAESQKGIQLEDVRHLTRAIKKATKKGMKEDTPALSAAIDLEQKCMEQIVVQKELAAAIESGKLEPLKHALDHANDLDMSIEMVTRVKKMINDIESNRPRSVRAPERETNVEMDEEEFEEHRAKNVKQAQHERYQFRKFYRIRTDGDYVKGLYFNKKRVAELKLQYQKTVIPRSILELDKDLNKTAINIHRSILGYCGEQLMSFPATLAQDVLIKGLELPDLVDEIYIQLCKHLTNNPKPESVGRAWQLMCMAVGTFPPSDDFKMFLLNFLLEHVHVGGLVGSYSRYALRRLDGMLIRGASGFVPNIDEILAYKERPPILATIELVDGTELTSDLPITPDLNVEKVLEICGHFLSLTDEREKFFGIWVVDGDDDEDDENPVYNSGYSAARAPQHDEIGPPSDEPPPPPLPSAVTSPMPPRTPRPLRNKDYMGDIVVALTRSRRSFRFVYKRKLFFGNNERPSKDMVFSRLMYLQAADMIIDGSIPVTKEPDVVTLTVIAIAADCDEFPNTEQDLLDESLMEYLPAPWRMRKPDSAWAKIILASRGKVAKRELEDLQTDYLSRVSKMPLWGHAFFYVRTDEHAGDEILSVSCDGVHNLSLARVIVNSWSFADIHRWGGSSSQFWLLVYDRNTNKKTKLQYISQQARDISSLILDYAVLASDRGGK
ncbi:Myosin-6 [Hondaea fermentalgiana]|uniref:Myosin-6 n=1 Tax=Hondaea fermentalgiana TaxID=2315210 RepID=A0A2R5G113_9STRA|nr:Myosin-6 [Hondaea fermentalgiana]|eukprot:GBG24692.1 Myosin-6 [Hondaea fermentalgiana]